MKITKFEEIESWREARILTKAIYSLTNRPKLVRDFGLRDQMQRASVSIMSNIAEGFDAGSNKAFVSFLHYSYRSASEVQSLLYVALDSEYISQEDFQYFFDQTAKTKGLIGGFMKYLKSYHKQ